MSLTALLTALAFLAVRAVSTPTSHIILPRQGYQGPYDVVTKCTCSNKENKSRIDGLCEGLWGSLPDSGRIDPGWNVCYVYYKSSREQASSKFSDANCQARFGKGFTGDCVDYPGIPAAENYTPTKPGKDVSKTSQKCCDQLITEGYLPVPECCHTLEEVHKPSFGFSYLGT